MSRHRHGHHAAEIHFEVTHDRKHPHVRFFALQHIRVYRCIAAADDFGFDSLLEQIGKQRAQFATRLLARQPHRFGTALARRPQIADQRKRRRLAMHVERVVELHRRILATLIQMFQDRGHVEVHRIHLAAYRAKFGGIVANLIQISGKAFGAAAARLVSVFCFGHGVTLYGLRAVRLGIRARRRELLQEIYERGMGLSICIRAGGSQVRIVESHVILSSIQRHARLNHFAPLGNFNFDERHQFFGRAADRL